AIVLDAAILFEAGWDRLCDLVVFIDAPFPVRLGRVARQRGWTAEVLQARETAQWPVDVKRERASVRVRNDASLDALEQNADRLLEIVNRGSAADPLLEQSPVVGPCSESIPVVPGDAR
ncbi:MAG: dephospho-CoA kinase, partial [Isosphaeraceae bacterium]